MKNIGQNKLKVNRLANRQSDSRRNEPNSFRFSAKYDSNRSYIAHLKGPELGPEKDTKGRSRAGGGFGHEVAGFGWEAGSFELDCAVGDFEFALEAVVYLRQNFFALFQVHVGDANVAGKGLEIGAESPDVDVVNFLDAFDAQNRAGYFFELHAAGQTFEQDVGALAQDAVAGPQDHRADGEADGGIDPVRARPVNRQRPGKNGHAGKSVACGVDDDRAQVQIVAALRQRQSDPAIHNQGEQRDPQHHSHVHRDRISQARIGFVEDVEGDDSEEQRIHERRQNSRAMIAVGFFARGRTLRQAHREPGNYERGNVGEVVDRIAHQGNRMAQVAADQFGKNKAQSRDDGNGQQRGELAGDNMAVGGVAVTMIVTVAGMPVSVRVHDPNSTPLEAAAQP
jgi:hypothetical protein